MSNILLKIDGIDGTSNVGDHEKWHQCESLEFETFKPISTETGKVQDRASALTQIKDIILTRKTDSSSAQLFKLACGSDAKKVEIHIVSGTGANIQKDIEWMLEDTLFSKYSIKGGSQNDTVETFQLNFKTVEMKTTVSDSTNKAGSPFPVKFSRETGKTG